MRTKVLIAIGVIVVLVTAYLLLSPLFREERVDESLEDILNSVPEEETGVPEEEMSELTAVRSGTFSGLAGHAGEGTATLIESNGRFFVRFESDFSVTNGPDLFVHFGRNGEYDGAARLGELKGNVGSQNYEVPTGLDPTNFDEVWIWCRAFSVPFAKAVLR